jgi:uncharacterized membrane protein
MTTSTRSSSDQRRYRLDAIDMLRGLVIVIMAIDHVRDYTVANAPLDPLADPNVAAAMFFTRWITHYCAPVFVTLAGVSAGLMTARKSRSQLGRFLLTRGLWLVFVEFAIVSTAWTFAPRGIVEMGGRTVIPLQVIWAIGVSMIALAGFQALGRSVCLSIGIAVLAAHNLLDAVWPMTAMLDTKWPLWVALHAQMAVPAGPFLFVNVYPFPVWIGVILLGFGASRVFELPEQQRKARLLRAGVLLTAGFVVLRALDAYGDPNHWQVQTRGIVATAIDFLNTTKYPPSLQFLTMTLGPSAIICALADRVIGATRRVLVTFGRVPFAFYVAHLYLIHSISVILGVAQGFRASQMFTVFFLFPKGYGLPLPGVYAAWALVVTLLYPLCRWMAEVKSRRRDWWLSYL